MPPHSVILTFALRVILLYTLLVIPWPGVRHASAWLFRQAGSIVFSSFGPAVTVRFDRTASATTTEPAMDTQIIAKATRSEPPKTIRRTTSSRYMAVMPLATFFALVLSTPLPWRRRGRSLAWGVPILLVYILFRLMLEIIVMLCCAPGTPVYLIGDGWLTLLNAADGALCTSLLGSLVPPIIVWAAVTIRTGDLEQIFSGRSVPT
jgi:hypothetical protein